MGIGTKIILGLFIIKMDRVVSADMRREEGWWYYYIIIIVVSQRNLCFRINVN